MIPPRSILAAVDFSDASRVALGFAARLAKHCHAQLHVLHAEDPLLAAAARATGVDLARETREELGRFMQAAFPAGDWSPLHHAIEGAPADVICDIADREQVDLIVMGTHGMTAAARAIFGSVTEGVLVRARVSVLAVPSVWVPPHPQSPDLSGMGPVIAGLEETPPALEAVAAAARLAHVLGTSVAAVHVVPPIRVLERWQRHAQAAVSGRIQSALREFASLLPALASPVPIGLRVESGDVAEQLAAVAGADLHAHPLLVLGRRPPGARRGAPGAIAARVLARAPIPVLVYLGQA